MTRRSPQLPANSHGGHNDNHEQIQLDSTVSTDLHLIQMRPDQLRALYSLVATGEHVIGCYGVCNGLLEEIVAMQSQELVSANTRIEELEKTKEELRQDVVKLRRENDMLKGGNETLREENAVVDRSNDAEEDMMQALVECLQHLHERVEDLDWVVQVLVEEASSEEGDQHDHEHEYEHEHEASGHYFEGGWEDMAKLWRDGPPLNCASQPKPKNRPTDANLSDMANWFERSNAPSPEERRPRHDDREALRQIETERAILDLEDRLERTETRIERLVNRLDAQETGWELAAESIPILLGAIYGDRGDEDEDDDESCCKCSEGWEELGSADGDARLRGGMGGRDEDEEFVYDYGGYTNWDQVEIQERRQEIEQLKAQIRALEEAVHREDLTQSADLHKTTKGDDSNVAKIPKQTPFGPIPRSIFCQQKKEDKDANLRGGSSGAEAENNGNRDHANTRVHGPIPASPHLLCQEATSQIGDSIINYIIIYLPPGFIISDSTKPDLVFHSAVTLYYFPTGATEQVAQQEAWKQKSCGDKEWQNFEFHKVQSKQVLKNAIADMWERMGLSWHILTRGSWNFDEKDDHGDMYMVNDNNLFPPDRTQEDDSPKYRGGAGDEPSQTPSAIDEDTELLDEFKRIHDSLMEEARIALTTDSPEQHVHAWMTVATAAQTRNAFLERELETFREMNDSLIQDLQWHMDVQAALEEQLEASEADKRAMAEEYQDLRTFLHHLVVDSDIHAVCTCGEKGLSTPKGRKRSLGLETLRAGDEEALKSTTQTNDAEARCTPPKHPYDLTIDNERGATPKADSENRQSPVATAPSDSSHSNAVSRAKSFIFYPQRSTIVCPDTPPHIYLFPYKSTLPEIHEMIKRGSEREDLRNDPHVARILEIMQIREDMGIYLPDNVSDKRITIDIPECSACCHLDRETKIAAWQVSDADTESLEKLVERLDIESSADKSNDDTPTKTASSEGEQDYYQDVGDLISSFEDLVDTDNATDSPISCVCQKRPVCSTELHSKILHPRSLTTSESLPQQSRISTSLPTADFPARAPPNTPTSYGTIALSSHRVLKGEEMAMPKGPLSIRLARFMFPPKFVQQRDDDIRRFDWRHVRRLNPQSKDKSSRGFRYISSAHCEEWATQLDRHREHCDYCQGVFLEEDYAPSDQSIRHEQEAPKPTGGARRPWKKNRWPEKLIASSVPDVVEDSDPCLRGGAGSEADLEYDSEDWRCEWDDLASQTRSVGYQPRAFRNSSSLSTRTIRFPLSPIDRSATLRRWPQQSDLRTAMEFIRDGPTISDCSRVQMNASEVRAGKLFHSPLHVDSDNLTGSKTRHPLAQGSRGSQRKSALERPLKRYDGPQHRTSLDVSVRESESVLDLRAENWLENPRPAPPPPHHRGSASSSRYFQQSNDVGLTKVYEPDDMRFDAVLGELSFRSDRFQIFPVGNDFPENRQRMGSHKTPITVHSSAMLSHTAYRAHITPRPADEPIPPSPKPGLGRQLYKRYAAFFTMLLKYLNKLRQRLMAKKPKKSVSSSPTILPAAPAPSRMGWEARYINLGRPPLPFDKSLPPTPRASISTFNLHPEPKEKFPATLHLKPKEKLRAASWASVSTIERANSIAQAQDRANADLVSKEGSGWHVPTVAGPSDLVKEALMWLRYETGPGKM